MILFVSSHTGSDPFGSATISRHWDDGSETLENYEHRLRAAFEFFTKLGPPPHLHFLSFKLNYILFKYLFVYIRCTGVKYWSFHDRDISPEGGTLEETNAMLDTMTDLALKLQNETGVKLLWNTCNLFAHSR